MSNRTEADISAQAELRLSHLAQIEALTKPGLTKHERVRQFAKAAEFEDSSVGYALSHLVDNTAAKAVWRNGGPPKSLFANLPGCGCPVIAGVKGFPRWIEDDWQPTAADLEAFSRIQIERRFP